jgi:hypothetical protein
VLHIFPFFPCNAFLPSSYFTSYRHIQASYNLYNSATTDCFLLDKRNPHLVLRRKKSYLSGSLLKICKNGFWVYSDCIRWLKCWLEYTDSIPSSQARQSGRNSLPNLRFSAFFRVLSTYQETSSISPVRICLAGAAARLFPLRQ